MKKIFKKSLALAVSAALCLTALVGCLTVSAAGTATASISSVEVANGSTSATITVTIGSADDQVAAARFNLVAATGITLDTSAFDSTATNGDGYTPEGKDFTVISNGNMFLLEAEDEVLDNDATFSIPVTIADGTNPATYAVSFGDVLEVANYGTYDSTTQTWSNDEALLTVSSTNGGVTVAAAASTEPVVDGTLALGRTILARDKMGIRFMTVKSQLSKYADYYLEIASQHFRSAGTEYYKLTDAVDLYKYVAGNSEVPEGYNAQSAEDNNYVYFDYTGITAYEMTLPLSATIYCLDENGNAVAKSQTWTFTLAERIRTSAMTNTAADAVFVDMVNYGAAVQTYFAAQYPSSDLGTHGVLPNAGFDAYQQFATASVDADDAVSINSGVAESAANGAMVGKGLQVQATNQLYFMVLAGSNDVNDLSLRVTYINSYNTDKSAVASVSEMTKNNNIYYYYFDADKNVALYDTAVQVTAELYSGETLLYTRTYSVESFVAETMAGGSAELRAVGDTLMKFTYSLRAKLGMDA